MSRFLISTIGGPPPKPFDAVVEPPEHADPSPVSITMSEEDDEVLILYMAYRDEDETRAKAAFTAFFERHREYLYHACRSRFEPGMDGDQGASDLVQDTFIRAYERAETFDVDGSLTAEEVRLCVRAWLGKIAENLFLSYHKANADKLLLPDEEWQKLDGQPSKAEVEDPEQWSADRRLLEKALDTLNEKERIVVNFTYSYHRPGEEHQRLPNRVCEEIADMIGTKRSSLRKIRQRALEKIQEYFAEHRPHP